MINLMGDAYVNSGLVLTSKTGDNTYDFSPILSPVAGSLQNGFSICNFETAVDLYGGNSQLSYYPKYNAPLELPQALEQMQRTGCSILFRNATPGKAGHRKGQGKW